MKKRITILGKFGNNESVMLNGQTIKTKIVFEELSKNDKYEVSSIDSYGWIKHPFSLFRQVQKAAKTEDHIIMMLDYKGFHVFIKLLPLFVKNTKCTISYMVIGGWLPDFIKSHPGYVKNCNKFDAIFPETDVMINMLKESGIKNLHKIVNFKRLDISDKPKDVTGKPKRFCIFSRIMPEKGVEDAVKCIKAVNEKAGETVAELDMYGEVDTNYIKEFDRLKEDFPEYISYKGMIPFDKSVDILKDYYALLFPTHFKTEGVPGTIIDAYASGLPVISYDWESGSEVITDKNDGYLCEENVNKLIESVEYSIDHEDEINSMRLNCIEKAKTYTPDANIKKLIDIIDNL